MEGTKVECVKNNLDNMSKSFNEYLKKFDGDFSVANLKYGISTNLPNSTLAETSPPENYTISVMFNGNVLDNITVLEIVLTFAHETIHAEMFRKLMMIMNNGGDLKGISTAEFENNLRNGGFPGVFDYYSRFGISGFQHEQMAAHYRETIANVLREYDRERHSEQFYKDLSWIGLRGTSSWKKISQSDKDRINNTYKKLTENGNKDCSE